MENNRVSFKVFACSGTVKLHFSISLSVLSKFDQLIHYFQNIYIYIYCIPAYFLFFSFKSSIIISFSIQQEKSQERSIIFSLSRHLTKANEYLTKKKNNLRLIFEVELTGYCSMYGKM